MILTHGSGLPRVNPLSASSRYEYCISALSAAISPSSLLTSLPLLSRCLGSIFVNRCCLLPLGCSRFHHAGSATMRMPAYDIDSSVVWKVSGYALSNVGASTSSLFVPPAMGVS